MRLTINLPDGDLMIEFTPREQEGSEVPMVDQKQPAQVELSYQGDGGEVRGRVGFQRAPGVLP